MRFPGFSQFAFYCNLYRYSVGTYRVVPFTPAAGVLEWVDTLVSEYLIGNGISLKGAHERYRPGDWLNRACREKLAAANTREDMRATYDRIEVGLYKLNAVDPWLESAWFQPLNL
jgi:hypothetical protein